MAAKKDFGKMITGNRVQTSIQKATGKHGQQSPASEEEITRRKSEMKTQGRLGAKLDRINMAFSSDNYNFIRVMSRLYGLTMTEFTNQIIDTYRRDYPEVAQKVQALIDEVEASGVPGNNE